MFRPLMEIQPLAGSDLLVGKTAEAPGGRWAAQHGRIIRCESSKSVEICGWPFGSSLRKELSSGQHHYFQSGRPVTAPVPVATSVARESMV